MSDTVLYETRGAIAVLTLNRPEQRNSVDVELTRALRAALARFEADDAGRIAILTGAGSVFSRHQSPRRTRRGTGAQQTTQTSVCAAPPAAQCAGAPRTHFPF
jgi:enoyl-CoA hydratase